MKLVIHRTEDYFVRIGILSIAISHSSLAAIHTDTRFESVQATTCSVSYPRILTHKFYSKLILALVDR